MIPKTLKIRKARIIRHFLKFELEILGFTSVFGDFWKPPSWIFTKFGNRVELALFIICPKFYQNFVLDFHEI